MFSRVFRHWTFSSIASPSPISKVNYSKASKSPRTIDIPTSRLQVSFSRSSGPGGQNVNKLNTKAEVRFHLDSADWLPLETKERFKDLFWNRITKEGDFVIVSQRSRSQKNNLDDCFGKLEEMVQQALAPPPEERVLEPPKEVKRRMDQERLLEKKRRSQTKKHRSKPTFDD